MYLHTYSLTLKILFEFNNIRGIFFLAPNCIKSLEIKQKMQ